MLSAKTGDYLWMVEFRFGVPYPETIRKMVVTHTDAQTILNASRLPELQTAYMSSMPTVSSIEKIPQSAMSNIC